MPSGTMLLRCLMRIGNVTDDWICGCNTHFVGLVGRVTPCAPVLGHLRAKGAHGGARPLGRAGAGSPASERRARGDGAPPCDLHPSWELLDLRLHGLTSRAKPA